MWSYKSPIGKFTIKQNHKGKFDLLLDNEPIGTWGSPEAAADDLWSHSTGFDDWDDLVLNVEPPTDLSEWTKR